MKDIFDLDNIAYFLFMEEEEKRYKEQQEKQYQSEEVVVENKNVVGRETGHTKRENNK